MSTKRKLKRQKKKDAEKEMKQALGLFDKIPENCLTCKAKLIKRIRGWFPNGKSLFVKKRKWYAYIVQNVGIQLLK